MARSNEYQHDTNKADLIEAAGHIACDLKAGDDDAVRSSWKRLARLVFVGEELSDEELDTLYTYASLAL